MTCTNKKGHYIEPMVAGMNDDPRCAGFPDLLNIDMRTKGSNKALDDLTNSRKQNSDECKRQARKIKTLEANPRFDADQKVRQQWSDEVSIATRLDCQY